MTIKKKYSVDRIWTGDPCLPSAYAWDGLNCTHNSSDHLCRIIALDLSHNNLSGPIPDFLGQLPSLAFLDLSSNSLSGPIPTNLLQKSQNGSLTLRIDNNADLCTNPASSCDPIPNKKKSIVVKKIVTLTVTVGTAVLALLVACTIRYYKRKRRKVKYSVQGPQLVSNHQGPQYMRTQQGLPGDHEGPQSLHDNEADMPTGLQFKNSRYDELEVITENFKNKIAEGGFGPVYTGKHHNGTS